MEKEILIEVNNLSRIFPGSPEKIAVNNISFSLRRGEVLGFLGPNGAGKSTTLQMLTGNLAPSHGQIKIGGIDLLDNPLEAKKLIGYLPDTPPLYKELSVDEFLIYCDKLNQISRQDISSAVALAKQHCGLNDNGKQIIGNLSKGYQQRVGIAQAIIHAPDVVILDEPTVGLDPIQIVEIRNLIIELGKIHSVMLSSHILPEIQTICSNVQIINQGKLVFSDTINGLNEQMQTQSLCLHYAPELSAQTVDTNLLAAIKGVKQVTKKAGHYRVHCDLPGCQLDLKNIAQQIIHLSVKLQWGLYEIYPAKRSLEDIFMALTHEEVIDNDKPANQT